MTGQHMTTFILDDITELISTGIKTNPNFKQVKESDYSYY